jgi:hypothetical protein
MTRGLRISMPAVDPILDRTERSLVDRALAHLRAAQPRDSAMLWAQLKRVAILGEALEQAPSLTQPSQLGAVVRDEAGLVAELARLDPMSGDFMLPEKAIVARAFLEAKISLLRGFVTALAPGAPGAAPGLWRDFRVELGQSIYTLLSIHILVGLLTDPGIAADTKGRAARQLILIWDRAAQVEIDDFCPLLEAVWHARSHLSVRFGALLGIGEYLRLAQEQCPAEFLDFFTRDDVSEDEVQAFEEFLFGLPREELTRLRAAMARDARKVIDAAYATEVLGRTINEAATVDDPEAMYRSFRRRLTTAASRRLTGAPGPVCVAESYVMIYVLNHVVIA